MMQKVLLIEDDQIIRELYNDEMARSGFEVVACQDGNQGLQMLQTKQFDLVLLDIMLPGMTGLEVLKRIRLDPKNSHTKVVLLTNLGTDSVIKEGFTLGADGYLIKAAYNPDQIIVEIRKLLESKPTQPA